MHGEFDPVLEGDIPPPAAIDDQPADPEPSIRREYHVLEAELDLLERQMPDSPRRQPEQPQPRADRAEDLLAQRRSLGVRQRLGMPGVMEWNDDGAWDDAFGLDVAESFK